jgi:hypothetical protein
MIPIDIVFLILDIAISPTLNIQQSCRTIGVIELIATIDHQLC